MLHSWSKKDGNVSVRALTTSFTIASNHIEYLPENRNTCKQAENWSQYLKIIIGS
jgi:hypothetical protein